MSPPPLQMFYLLPNFAKFLKGHHVIIKGGGGSYYDTSIYLYICIYISIYLSIRLSGYVNIYVAMYIYIYIYIYTYIHMIHIWYTCNIYIHIWYVCDTYVIFIYYIDYAQVSMLLAYKNVFGVNWFNKIEISVLSQGLHCQQMINQSYILSFILNFIQLPFKNGDN